MPGFPEATMNLTESYTSVADTDNTIIADKGPEEILYVPCRVEEQVFHHLGRRGAHMSLKLVGGARQKC